MEQQQKTQEEFDREIDASPTMTPQEKLYSKLFYNETMFVVKDMDTLTLRAHREELGEIAFNARVRYAAAKNEEERRDKLANKHNGKEPGFSRSVKTDAVTSDVINTIKERQKRLTKAEKIKAGLIAMGVSEADADKMMSAGKILKTLNEQKEPNKTAQEIIKGEAIQSPLSQSNGFVFRPKPAEKQPAKQSEPVKTFVSPFGKK